MFSIHVWVATLIIPQLSWSAAADGEWRSCVDHFDAFMVQDVSETFHSNMESAVNLMTTWIDGIQSAYPQSRFGYATFTDKPVPISGFGPYGGWQSAGIQYDWCFSMEQSLVNDKEIFAASLRSVWDKRGSGFDWPESQLEAILRGATNLNVGWGSGDRNIRTIIMITDEVSHLEGDAAENIGLYNAPVRLTSAARMETDGGWGSHGIARGSIADVISTNERPLYETMASYIAREQWHPSGITADEETELADLKHKFGPEAWPLPVPHPGDDSMACDAVEYPSGEMVAKVLRERNIIPIVLVIGGEEGEHCSTGGGDLKALQHCPMTFYREWMRMNGLDGIVRPFPDDYAEAAATLIQAVEDTAAIVCPTTTSTTTTTTTPTTTTSTTTTTTTEETTTTPTTTTSTTTTTQPTTTTTEETTTTPTTTTSTTTTTQPTTTTTEETTTTPTTTTTTTTTTPTTTTTTPTTTTSTTTTAQPTTTTTEETTTTPTTTTPTTTTTTTTEETTTTPTTTTPTTTTTTTEETTTTLTTTPSTTTTTQPTTTTEETTPTPTTTTPTTTTTQPATTTTTSVTTSTPVTTEGISTIEETSTIPSTLTTRTPANSVTESTRTTFSSTVAMLSTTNSFLAPDVMTSPEPATTTPSAATSTTTTSTTTTDNSYGLIAVASAAGGAAALAGVAAYAASGSNLLGTAAFTGAETVSAAEGLVSEVAREAAQPASMEMFA